MERFKLGKTKNDTSVFILFFGHANYVESPGSITVLHFLFMQFSVSSKSESAYILSLLMERDQSFIKIQ